MPARPDAGRQGGGRTRDDGDVDRHLVVIVAVAAFRLVGEAMAGHQAVAEVVRVVLVAQGLDGLVVDVAGISDTRRRKS